MLPTKPSDPRASLHTAVRGLRALGTVFIAVWALILTLVYAVSPMRMQLGMLELFFLASSALVLLTPAIFYHIAAFFISRRELWAATLALRTAVCQCVLTLAGSILFFSTLSIHSRFLGNLRGPIFVPIVIAMFFLPALAAQLFALTKAIRAICLLPPTRHGFEPIPLTLPADQVVDSDPQQINDSSP
jgi:hypothetical protein